MVLKTAFSTSISFAVRFEEIIAAETHKTLVEGNGHQATSYTNWENIKQRPRKTRKEDAELQVLLDQKSSTNVFDFHEYMLVAGKALDW